MKRLMLVKLLKDEIQHLKHLAEAMEDMSILSCPDDYNCSRCINDIIFHLKKIRSECSKLTCVKPKREFLSKFWTSML